MQDSIKDNPAHDLAETILDFCFFTFRNQKTRLSGVPENLNEQFCKEILMCYYSNVKDIRLKSTINYLIEATQVVSIELFTLGLVRGDYSFSDCHSFISANEHMIDELKRIINTVKTI